MVRRLVRRPFESEHCTFAGGGIVDIESRPPGDELRPPLLDLGIPKLCCTHAGGFSGKDHGGTGLGAEVQDPRIASLAHRAGVGHQEVGTVRYVDERC